MSGRSRFDFESGYFAIPHRITAEELRDKLGIPDQAASERLQRAQPMAFISLLLADATADDD